MKPKKGENDMPREFDQEGGDPQEPIVREPNTGISREPNTGIEREPNTREPNTGATADPADDE
jgi:hypothetical protein